MDRWKEIEQLYFRARALALEEQDDFLNKACQGTKNCSMRFCRYPPMVPHPAGNNHAISTPYPFQ